MILRYLGISFLKFTADILVILVLYTLVLPETFPPLALSALTWVVMFTVAFVFASWAVAKRIPVRQDMLALVAVWLTVTVGGYLIYGILLSSRGPWAAVSPELLIQYAVELVAIFFAVWRRKRRHAESNLGEGAY
ncbi:hypothetical protein HY479_02255 [Candidatus Uhrbacteria bacterium]|nr:hypothetical protein [Candidatus Uhrbacteria bacterium]